MKWWREIKKIGFGEWWWFVVKMKRNEFNPKIETLQDRHRAHRLDCLLENVK